MLLQAVKRVSLTGTQKCFKHSLWVFLLWMRRNVRVAYRRAGTDPHGRPWYLSSSRFVEYYSSENTIIRCFRSAPVAPRTDDFVFSPPRISSFSPVPLLRFSVFYSSVSSVGASELRNFKQLLYKFINTNLIL